jgi:hypothetical protein
MTFLRIVISLYFFEHDLRANASAFVARENRFPLCRIMLGGPPMSFFPKFLLAFLIVTPVFLFISVLAAGGGHGSYLPAKLLFPWSMAGTAFTGTVTQALLALAIAQYPVYGIVLDWARYIDRLMPGTIALAAVHFVGMNTALLMAHGSFTP